MKHGQKKPIPKNEGATVNFRRFNRLPTATVPLVEGITPAGKNLDISSITAVVQGYGDWVLLSDFIDMAGIDPVATETLEVLAEQAGETLDELVRDEVAAGTNVYRVNGRVARNLVQAGDILDGATIRRARRIMARNNVKTIGGSYIGFIHPDAAFDITGDVNWIASSLYGKPGQLFDHELGKLYGIRFIETTKCPIWEDAGLNNLVDVYGTLIVGANAYGVPDIAGSSKPESIIKPLGSAGSADALNQRSSCGWKAYMATIRLDELCILRLESAVTV